MGDNISRTQLKTAALSMQVAHITFEQLNEFTKTYASSISPTAQYADTAQKLIEGLLHEFDSRGNLLNLGVKQR
jgi:ABC-type transporter Mla subunit MlaD